jgi:surface carbohydrate biosynthesis protein
MRNLLLSTEIINRDLDFQIVFAALTARTNDRIFIGRRDAISRVVSDTDSGLFVGKAFDPSFPNVDMSFYQRMKDRRFTVVHLDDEGAVFVGEEADWVRSLERRLDASRIAADDFVCVWGDWQGDVYRTRAMNPGRVRTTGHPRFDFLRSSRLRDYYGPALADLRSKHGDSSCSTRTSRARTTDSGCRTRSRSDSGMTSATR